MNFDNYRKELGAFIRKTRQEQGLSLQQLIRKKDPLRPAVSENTLRGVEDATTNAKQETITIIFDLLGKTMGDFAYALENESKVKFANDTKLINDLIRAGQYQQAKEQYLKLKEETYCNLQDTRVQQLFASYEGVFLDRLEGEQEQALNTLLKGLLLRRPELFIKRKRKITLELDIAAIEKIALERVDYRMLVNIASIQFSVGQREMAVELQESVITSLNFQLILIELREEMLSWVYFNLSNHLLELGMYGRALVICQQGVDVHKKNKTSRYLGELYSNMGEVYGKKNDKKRAHNHYKLAVEQFVRDNELDKAEITKNGRLMLMVST